MLVYRKSPSCHITITFPRTSSIITLKSPSRVCTENCGKSAKSLHQMLWGVSLWKVARPLCVMLLRAWNVISLSLVEQLSSARQEFPCCQPQKTTHTHTHTRSSSSRDTSGAVVRKAQLAVFAVLAVLVGWLKCCRRQSSGVKCPKCQAQWRQRRQWRG